MVESLLVIVLFVVFYAVLHPLFHLCVEAVSLWAIAVAWLLAIPYHHHPVLWACAVASLLAGAFFGFRIIPAQALAGLGFPPRIAADHVEFDRIAKRIGSSEFREQEMGARFMNLNPEQSMHLSAMRLYNGSVFWAICGTCGHIFFFYINPGFAACIAIALTSFPVGFVFKRWLARRLSAMS